MKQESDFAERQFYQDIYQKQRTATGARYKRGHLNKGGYVLPTDRMSDAQIQKQNGEVVSANMNTPMTWQQFQVLSNGPSGSKAMYIRFLKDTFQANAGMIASMFGINAVTLSKHIKEDHLNISFPRGGRPS